jgi:transposase
MTVVFPSLEDTVMASAHMADEFYELVSHHLPPEQPVGPKGGRRRKTHRIVMNVIWYVLATGCRWEDVPREMGCSGRTAHRRLREWQALGVWDRLHADLLRLLRQEDKLDPEVAIVDSVMVRAFGGGAATGPSPVDRRKSGTKYTLLVDRHGAPIGIRTAPANASDQTQLLPLVVHFPQIGGKPGRPKRLPDAVVADRGFDNDHLRWLLAWLGVEPRIGRRRTPHGSGLGQVRWVVERTISWLKGLRRLRVRYDRLLDVQHAWNSLAASVICFRLLHEEYVLAA